MQPGARGCRGCDDDMSAGEPPSDGGGQAAFYATLADRYWRTFLPTRHAALGDASDYFDRVGALLASWVETKAGEFTDHGVEPSAALVMAHEYALRRGVFLDPEPGTENAPFEYDGERHTTL